MKRYAAEQFGLLCSAFRLLKPGGRLVYSTCTLNSVEDDGVVEKLLKKFPEAFLETAEVPGTPEQIGDLLGIRFWPQKTGAKGFFCVAILKTDSVEYADGEPVNGRLGFLSNRRALPYLKYLEKRFGIDGLDLVMTSKEGNIFLVSRELTRFKLPGHYSLTFPLLKKQRGDLQLTHAGALWIAGLAKKGVFEIERDDVEEYFKNGLESEGLLTFSGFPLGLPVLPKTF